jgi:tripartite-type tricarboxylate transporter receptor subunit TctC
MKPEKKWYLALVLTTVLLAATAAGAFAQGYPTKPVRWIVPYPPGGGADLVGRVIGQKLNEKWGQQVVIDNRGGAGATIGTAMAAKADPDGYTFILASPAHAINATLYTKLPFNTEKDFIPVTQLTSSPNFMVVPHSLPAKTVREFIALAKSKPGQLNYASSGRGTGTHLSGVLFNLMAGVDILHVPYKGGGPAMNDLIAGQVQLMFEGMTSVQHAKSGKARILAVTTAKRSLVLPDVPTISEAGLPGYEVNSWYGVYLPAGTPQKIVTQLNQDIVQILRLPDVQARLASLGAEVVGSTEEQFTAFTKAEIDKWAKVVTASGARVD